MRDYWLFTPWFTHPEDMDRFGLQHPIANSEQLQWVGNGPELDPGSFPVADLRIAFEDFADDCFKCGTSTFVSEHMRRAMNLKSSEVQYFDIDATRSSAKVRSMNYQIMNVPVIEEAADLGKSKYLQCPPISPRMGILRSAQEIHIRDDLTTTYELFNDSIFHRLVCTDALALRVLAAGCTGIRFIDPLHPLGNIMRWRTLRGVEAHEWDPEVDDFVTRVVDP